MAELIVISVFVLHVYVSFKNAYIGFIGDSAYEMPSLSSSNYRYLILFGGLFVALYFTIYRVRPYQHFFARSHKSTIDLPRLKPYQHFSARGNKTFTDIPRAIRTETKSYKLVLLYTKFFNGPWLDYPRLGPVRYPINEKLPFENCEIPWCKATYDKNRVSEANAIGFHARDMSASFKFPAVRKSHQIWFYYVLENPLNVPLYKNILNTKFNWTMSYRRESEIHVPYGNYILRTHSKKNNKSYVEGKSEFAVWMASNCGSNERNEYVKSLRRHIPVTVYGRCGDKVCPLPRRSLACKRLLKKHKFYLAFENGNCLDYITEKYWENAIENEILPVVMGGADYSSLAIPGSYIDVTKFSSPQKLAEYLKYLDKNDTAYNEYFLWKEKYEQIAPKIACTLCKQLHNSSLIEKTRGYYKLEEFWGRNLCRNLNLKT